MKHFSVFLYLTIGIRDEKLVKQFNHYPELCKESNN
jgi:hypothetical protein